jgi:glycosyltransferase involved in cell wall biosynthesis
VIDQLGGGGAEVSLLEYLTESHRDPRVEHFVVALNGRPDTLAAAEALPMQVSVGPPGRRPRPGDVKLVREAIDHYRPDIVHCTLVRSTFATSAALRGTDLPMMVSLTSVHYDVEDTTGTFKQRAGLRVSHTIHGAVLRRRRVRFHAVSQPVADKAVEVFGLDPERITVIPRGRPDPITRVTATRDDVRSREGIAESQRLTITVAREHLIKNHQALLEAASILRERVPGLRVAIVGGASTATEVISKTIAELGLSETVLRLGHREDVPDLLQGADLYVSTSKSEGLPGSIVEAMGMGLPVVAFDVPGVRDVLDSAHRGLVPFDEVDTLADRIEEILVDDDLRADLGSKARARFEDHYEIGAYVHRIGDLYESLLARDHVPDRVDGPIGP